ncbi:MAG: DUF2147 domain-containing protein [Alphaproteobacteria bacterium]|nr:DUF2147 domain-containing protein [Alphaproteobacteria bacterium]
MKKIIFTAAFALATSGAFALPLTGFYKTIDDKTNNAKSIVRLYECGDALCGRIVALFDADGTAVKETLNNPERVADKVSGAPKMAGLDIIWNMEWDARDNEYSGGKIMDPQSGSVYSSVIWADKDDANLLRVRGKIGPFGRTQVWHVMQTADLPSDLQKLDVSKWEPVIIK